MRLSTILLLVATSMVAQTPEPTDARGWLNLGVQAYRNGQYSAASEDFRRVVGLDPSNINARLYLATSYMTMYVPGVNSPENNTYAEQARAEFQRVLELNPNEKTALASLASLSYQEAQGLSSRDDKLRKLDESRDWNLRLQAIDPENKQTYYTLGVIDWLKWYPPYMQERMRLGMRPETPGPLPDANARQRLNAEYGQLIADGIANLDKALAIDPQYDDAMAYMNLLIRQRADLRDTKSDYELDIQAADAWVKKALDTKRTKALSGMTESPSGAPLRRLHHHPRAAVEHHNASASAPSSRKVTSSIRLNRFIRPWQSRRAFKEPCGSSPSLARTDA